MYVIRKCTSSTFKYVKYLSMFLFIIICRDRGEMSKQWKGYPYKLCFLLSFMLPDEMHGAFHGVNGLQT